MHTIRFFPLILVVLLLLTSCDKDPYRHGELDLSPITIVGRNTLGFLLNGKVWVPYQVSSGIFTPTIEAHLNRDFLLYLVG
jgi:hypothetical protein